MNIQDLIMAEYLVLVPFIYIVGMFLKKWGSHDDRLIPTTLGALGIIMGIIITYASVEVPTLQDIINGVIQGVFASGLAVFGNELAKNLMSYIQGEE